MYCKHEKKYNQMLYGHELKKFGAVNELAATSPLTVKYRLYLLPIGCVV